MRSGTKVCWSGFWTRLTSFRNCVLEDSKSLRAGDVACVKIGCSVTSTSFEIMVPADIVEDPELV
jgi:hypothetical protein